jgi:5-methylcytosine-specific restriction endonuclease McrA
MEERLCAQCNESFPRPAIGSNRQWEARKYCSRRCTGLAKVGTTHTPETCERLRQAHKGTKKPWAGYYERSPEHRKAIADRMNKMYETPLGDQVKQRLSIAHKGRRKTPEQRAALAEAAKRSPRYRGGSATRKYRKAFYQRQREISKYANGGSHTIEEWESMKLAYRYRCPACQASEPTITLTEDHVIPLSRGGTNNIENIQPLCQSCNSRKNARIIPRYPKPEDSNH